MTTARPPLEIESLLQHGEFARRIARALLADPGRVEDIGQEVWLAARQRPPTGDPRSWLQRVVRNLVWSGRRDERRRQELLVREAAGGGARHERSAAQEVERLELLELVARAVLRLDEPYRSALTHRFYDGGSAAQIARREGIPESTVRTRVRRGLQQLRRQLDDRVGEDWRGSMALWALGTGGIGVAGSGPGAAGGSTKAAVGASLAAGGVASLILKGLGVAVALILVAGWWSGRRGSETEADEGPALASREPLDSTPPRASSVVAIRREAEPASPTPPEEATIRGRVVGSRSEEPVGSGEVKLFFHWAAGLEAPEQPGQRVAPIDAQGCFEMRLPGEVGLDRVEIRSIGRHDRRAGMSSPPFPDTLPPTVHALEGRLASGEQREVRWTWDEGIRLSGVVLDAETRAPMAGVVLGLFGTQDREAAAFTDAAGRWSFAAIRPQHLEGDALDLDVHPPRSHRPLYARLRLREGELDRSGLEILVDRGRVVYGVVEDAEGQAVSGARVVSSLPPLGPRGGVEPRPHRGGSHSIYKGRITARSEADGRFEMVGLPLGCTPILSASVEEEGGAARSERVRVNSDGPGQDPSDPVLLRLRPLVRNRVELIDGVATDSTERSFLFSYTDLDGRPSVVYPREGRHEFDLPAGSSTTLIARVSDRGEAAGAVGGASAVFVVPEGGLDEVLLLPPLRAVDWPQPEGAQKLAADDRLRGRSELLLDLVDEDGAGVRIHRRMHLEADGSVRVSWVDDPESPTLRLGKSLGRGTIEIAVRGHEPLSLDLHSSHPASFERIEVPLRRRVLLR